MTGSSKCRPMGFRMNRKQTCMQKILTAGTQYHREKCPEYGRFLRALGCPAGSFFCKEEIPFLPVSVFKELDLKSIPEDKVFKVITSSGTSGQRPSRIFLDAETSAVQQKVLARIVSEEIGDRRLPCLMLDTKSVLRDRRHFSARGAGILGFSVFASRIRAVTGIDQVRSYYGMAEQTGSICMECQCGHLHASTWSDIIVRRESVKDTKDTSSIRTEFLKKRAVQKENY